MKLGDLELAYEAFTQASKLIPRDRDNLREEIDHWLATCLILGGRWFSARYAVIGGDSSRATRFHAVILLGLGRVNYARHLLSFIKQDPHTAREFYPTLLIAKYKQLIDRREVARQFIDTALSMAKINRWLQIQHLAGTLLAHMLVPSQLLESRSLLTQAREYGARSGDLEIILRCYHLAAFIAHTAGDLATATVEAEAGVQQADDSGFYRWSVDIRLELTRIYLSAGRWRPALQAASRSIELAAGREADYAWDLAEGHRLSGTAYAKLGESRKALEHLYEARGRLSFLNQPSVTQIASEISILESLSTRE